MLLWQLTEISLSKLLNLKVKKLDRNKKNNNKNENIKGGGHSK